MNVKLKLYFDSLIKDLQSYKRVCVNVCECVGVCVGVFMCLSCRVLNFKWCAPHRRQLKVLLNNLCNLCLAYANIYTHVPSTDLD